MQTKFIQKTKLGVAGSLTNQLMANNATLPIVGKGATQLHYSDRSCYEVIEVSKDSKTVKLEILNAKADTSKGEVVMGHQNWILEPTNRFITVVWRYNRWHVKGSEIQFTNAYKELAKAANMQNWEYLKSTISAEDKEVFWNKWNYNIVVDGITELKTVYSPIQLLFGTKDYRYDWEF